MPRGEGDVERSESQLEGVQGLFHTTGRPESALFTGIYPHGPSREWRLHFLQHHIPVFWAAESNGLSHEYTMLIHDQDRHVWEMTSR